MGLNKRLIDQAGGGAGAGEIVTDGLYYYFDANDASTVSGGNWADKQGTGNDATAIGSTSYTHTGTYGYWDLNHSVGGLVGNNNIYTSTSIFISVDMWVKFDVHNTNGYLLGNETATSRHILWSTYSSTAGNAPVTFSQNYQTTTTSNVGLYNDLGWHHWAFSRVSSYTWNFYLDGNYIFRLLNFGGTQNSPLTLGASNYTGNGNIKGKLSSVRFYYNKSLTADEVLQNYNAESGLYP